MAHYAEGIAMSARRLVLETLEGRNLLAGNVTASVVDGELRITGDGGANWVQVTQIPGVDGKGTTFQVKGLPFNATFRSDGTPAPGTLATTVNGQASVLYNASSDKIRSNLGSGNDVFTLLNADLAALVLNTGDGRDYVGIVSDTFYSSSPNINTGTDAQNNIDDVRFASVTCSTQGIIVATGGGNDNVSISSVTIKKTLSLNTSQGNDTVRISSLTCNGLLTASLGSGADNLTLDHGTLNTISLDFGDGNDTATMSYFTSNGSTFKLGGGNDLLNFKEQLQIKNYDTVDGGDGDDSFHRGSMVDPGPLSTSNIEHLI
jgi:hypothetical protein